LRNDRKEEDGMSHSLRRVDYFYVMVPNRAGQGAKILSALASEGVNLLAFSGFPSGGKGQLDLVPENSAALRRAAKKAGLKLSKRKTGFLLQGDDRVGALTSLLGKLADAKISVTAVDAVTAGRGRFGAIFWVKQKSVGKAARLLAAR
jgi:hypothetical protein